MRSCYTSGDFKKYFTENMNALGLPAPQNLFDSYSTAVANAALMAEALRTLGKGATIGELVGATTGLEKLKVAAAFGASYYVGAVIGSIAIASGRSLGCGYRISDMVSFLDHNNLKFDDWNAFFVDNPQVLNKNQGFRNSFGLRARA